MSSNAKWSPVDGGIRVSLDAPAGLLARLRQTRAPDLTALPTERQSLAYALAEARALGADDDGAVHIEADSAFIAHDLVARLSSEAADALGLPPLVDLTFHAETQGVLGGPNFRMTARWTRRGVDQSVRRVGSILKTAAGVRRLPHAIYLALEAADGFAANRPLSDHWTALARFRHSLDPEADTGDAQDAATRVEMGEFLRTLRIDVADAIGMSPNESGSDFEVLPFSRDALVDEPSADTAAVVGGELIRFQRRVREQGARPSYRIGDRHFLAIDRSAAPVLRVMAEKQRAAADARAAFVRDPRPAIAEAVEAALRDDGRLDGLSDEEAEATLEAELDPAFVETREFAERVIGVARWRKPELDIKAGSGTTWLPELFAEGLAAEIERADAGAIEALRDAVQAAMARGEPTVEWRGHEAPASEVVARALDARATTLRGEQQAADTPKPPEPAPDDPPVEGGRSVLEVRENFEDVAWRPDRGPRAEAPTGVAPPKSVRTALMPHQLDSLDWAVRAWCAGLPGVLNADEQGLGKTLQTLSFLAWLRERMEVGATEARHPVLIVAPTSLLQNWEAEVERHLDARGLGNLIRLYGGEVGRRKQRGASGVDIDGGVAKLDFATLDQAIVEGRGWNQWVLTTYTTLANYHFSLAAIPFAAAVFDEIQALKNPEALRSAAAKTINADFRIGLTGTPVENRSEDLWAVMDQIAPGALGSLRDFSARYGEPTEETMHELHAAVFKPSGDLPALGLRRLKVEVARDLPTKTRIIHARVMPNVQADAYDVARATLKKAGRGGALKALQHIRSVSVHPGGDTVDHLRFEQESARMIAGLQVLRWVRDRGERALVFIEHRKIQHRFAELARLTFGLPRVDVINGDTPIPKRMATVNRFQRHLEKDEGFDLLVLGPRAAGTGLTLTAATHVIHLSRWWNPAVEEQCNDRAHRIGQTRPVTVHLPLAIHPELRAQSFDCLLHALMRRKRALATTILWPEGDTGEDVAQLLAGLQADERVRAEKPAASVQELAAALGDHVTVEPIGSSALRIRPVEGGAAVIVALDEGRQALGAVQGDDAEVVILGPGRPSAISEGCPAAVLGGLGHALWPDSLVP